MKSKRFSKPKIFGLVVLVLVALFYKFFRVPSNAEMIVKFHQHKAEFEQIRLMLKQDKNVAVIAPNRVEAKFGDKNGKQPEDVELHPLPLNISQSRIELYRSRLGKLGYDRVVVSNERILMTEHYLGFMGSTTAELGYMWSPKPLMRFEKPVSSKIENGSWHFHIKRVNSNLYFSPIEDNWYIYYLTYQPS